MFLRSVVAVCGLILLGPAIALGHPAPFSYLDLRIGATAITGSLAVHTFDVGHELGIEPPERVLEPAIAESIRARLIALLTPRFTIRAGDRELVPDWLGIDVLAYQSEVRLSFRIQVERPATLSVRARMFPYDPVHQTFLNVYEDGTLRQQQVFAGSSPEWTYYSGSRQGALAVMRTFIPSGVHHILIGPDHILFLVGLLLLGGTWKTLVAIVSAFTIGHSVTLSLAALNIVTPPARIIEPAIALSIVFVGTDNLVRGEGRDLRAWVALVFGLVHGFGFANVLREFGLPREALGWSLFSFNVGVEIGQLAVVVVVTTALTAVRRWRSDVGYRVAYAGSLVVIAAGAYWFVERVFFPA
jgi:hypothetical protein